MRTQSSKSGINRREFGKLAGAAGLALGVSPGLVRSTFVQGAPDSAKIIAGKASGMLVDNADLGVMETPLAMLRKYDHTSIEILFNRLHFPHKGTAA